MVNLEDLDPKNTNPKCQFKRVNKFRLLFFTRLLLMSLCMSASRVVTPVKRCVVFFIVNNMRCKQVTENKEKVSVMPYYARFLLSFSLLIRVAGYEQSKIPGNCNLTTLKSSSN